jgi:hypothetical protein
VDEVPKQKRKNRRKAIGSRKPYRSPLDKARDWHVFKRFEEANFVRIFICHKEQVKGTQIES